MPQSENTVVEWELLTLRAGCRLELRPLIAFAEECRDADAAELLNGIADRARESFNAQFWNEAADCFYDVVNGAEKGASIRPNQVIALGLRHTMPSSDRARRALAVVKRELLTPQGLRTLAPFDPAYRGRYAGAPAERDAVYHQGTVWPWLLGPFATAYAKAHAGSSEARARARELLSPLLGELDRGCVGQIAEIFDGDPPHTPRGCCAQAWSVAEPLRALVEDVGNLRGTLDTAAPGAKIRTGDTICQRIFTPSERQRIA